MPREIDQNILQAVLLLLKWLGATSVVGFLALYTAWISFPPELVIEGVSDKSKKFNTQSRIKIKNNGILPALAIKSAVTKMYAVINTNRFNDCAVFSGFNVVARLSRNETIEISISPGVHVEGNIGFTEFSYILVLTYHAKLFFLKKERSKKWKVSLNTFADGFSWDIKII